MTRVNGRIARGKQRDEGGLWPLQVERRRVALGAYRFQVAVPSFSRVGAKHFRTVAQEKIPGAFYIRGGGGLAVMPTDAAPKLKGEFGHVGIPRPLGRQIRHDRVYPVLGYVLSE